MVRGDILNTELGHCQSGGECFRVFGVFKHLNFEYYLIVFWNDNSLSDSKKSNFFIYVDQGMCNERVEDREGGLQCSACIAPVIL